MTNACLIIFSFLFFLGLYDSLPIVAGHTAGHILVHSSNTSAGDTATMRCASGGRCQPCLASQRHVFMPTGRKTHLPETVRLRNALWSLSSPAFRTWYCDCRQLNFKFNFFFVSLTSYRSANLVLEVAHYTVRSTVRPRSKQHH